MKKVKISDIAKEAQVSLSTASRALNGHYVKDSTYQRITEAYNRLYHEEMPPLESDNPPVLGSLRENRNRLILVFVPDLENTFYAKIISGIHDSAATQGYHYLIYQKGIISCEEFRTIVNEVGAAGAIILSPVFSADLLSQMNSIIPIVQCCEYNSESNISYVSIDDFMSAKNATEYILSKGHSKIALINGPSNYKYARERCSGYQAALENAGLPINENWIVNLQRVNYDLALSAITQILNHNTRPDAFFCVSDTLATAAIKAATLAHISIPDELAVVGFDNTPISQLCTPTITTVNQPQIQLGCMSCEVLIDHITTRDLTQRKIILQTELIIRESS